MLLLTIIISYLCVYHVRGQQAGSIRLWNNRSSSSSLTAGRVQVYYTRRWGNICRFSSFSTNAADVICHQLTYTGSSSWSYTSTDTYGIDTNPVVVGDVFCSNSQYLTLFQCSLSSSTSCSDNDDIGVNCCELIIIIIIIAGIIGIFNWQLFIIRKMEKITCRGGTCVDDVLIINGGSNFGGCYGYTQIKSTCCYMLYDNYGYTCISDTTRIWNNPYNGQIRLTGGSYSNEGLLEIYCNGRWGTVCRDSFFSSEANAACKQLGYSSSFRRNYDSSLRGNSSQPIWLDNVDCSSSDTCLTSCQNCPGSENHNCGHSEDVTIDCHNFILNGNTNTVRGYCSTAGPSSAGSISGIVIGIIVGTILLIAFISSINIYHRHKRGRINWFRGTNRRSNAIPAAAVIAATTTTTTTTGSSGTTGDTGMPLYTANQAPPPPYNPSMPNAPGAPYPPPVAYPSNPAYPPSNPAYPPPPPPPPSTQFGYIDNPPTTQYGYGGNAAGNKFGPSGFVAEEPPAYDPGWGQPPNAPQSIFKY